MFNGSHRRMTVTIRLGLYTVVLATSFVNPSVASHSGCPQFDCQGQAIADGVWMAGFNNRIDLSVPPPVDGGFHFFCGGILSFADNGGQAYDAIIALGLVSEDTWVHKVKADGGVVQCTTETSIYDRYPLTIPNAGALNLVWQVHEFDSHCGELDDNGHPVPVKSCSPEFLSTGIVHRWNHPFSIEVLPNPGTCQETAAGAALHASEGAAEPSKECVVTAGEGLWERIKNCLRKLREGKWCTSAPANVNNRETFCELGLIDKCQCEYWFPDKRWATPLPRAGGRARAGASPSDYRGCGEGPGSSELLPFPGAGSGFGPGFGPESILSTPTASDSPELRERIVNFMQTLSVSAFTWTELRAMLAVLAFHAAGSDTKLEATSSEPDVIEAAMVGYDLYLRPRRAGTAVVTISVTRRGVRLPVVLEIPLTYPSDPPAGANQPPHQWAPCWTGS